MIRLVVTGSGRCGTKYMSQLLTAAGIPCGHEKVYNHRHSDCWPAGLEADSSWMAATQLNDIAVPIVLLVRHPLAVVRSWVEIGFFSDVDATNPTHGPLRRFAPQVYDYVSPADRALAMWIELNEVALARAELVLRLHQIDAVHLGRLLRWAGVSDRRADVAFASTRRVNRHERMRARTGVTHRPTWIGHSRELTIRGRRLANLLGFSDGFQDG